MVGPAAMLLLTSCGSGTEQPAGGRGGAGQGPPEVGFVVVQPTTAPIVAELSGRTSAYESSDVRPQVSGIIRRRYFTEGALVRQGQPLYEVDPSLYRAAVAQASANLSAAQATARAAQTQAARFAPLARIEAVSQQEYTNAVAQARQGSAQVAQNRAALETARINLKFTTVPAPISGRIGRSLFTVGALVSTSQAEPLAQIQRLDPIFVDIQQSAADLIALRRQMAASGAAPARAEVRLTLPDGSEYPAAGTVEFAEAVVGAETGTVTLRARFPNRDGLLLPGLFVRARFAQAIDNSVYLVPQPAVSRDPRGGATLYVVGPGNQALRRTVKAERTQGQYWVVTEGLQPGDRVITQGLGRLQQAAARRGGSRNGAAASAGGAAPAAQSGGGIPVRPVPANAPQRVQAPPAGGAR
ncbi:efflux RND transporter periplasmic adaptor subunit [Sphingomonas sp.]|uniref:efflux RND transporter periplasmic adaptor subunit n=1 Tax=Sphingomonas sp. TaxID=28214 RepID=UPI0039C946F6